MRYEQIITAVTRTSVIRTVREIEAVGLFVRTVDFHLCHLCLTPIGHQNNTLILGPAGLRFGDYWKLGLPMEILVVSISIPALLVFWPM